MKRYNKASRISLSILLATLGASIAGCGGGGSAPTPTPTSPPTNRAPQFSSSDAATIAENSAGVFYTASANDPDGDPLTFAISGTDAGAFSLAGSDLSFVEIPDFERPADGDRDNIYDVTITVQDGRGGSADLSLFVTVENDKEGIAVTRVATGFDDPVGLGFLLSTGPSGFVSEGRIAVAQANGEIFDVDGTTGDRTLLADVFDGRPRGELLAIGFSDRRNGFYSGLYAVAQDPGGRVFVQRYARSPLPETEILPSGTGLVSATIFEGANPSVPGGALFMTLSDESGVFAQDTNSRLGKLIQLRLQDPFAGTTVQPRIVPEIIGSGLRNSGGAGPINGQILISDQGGSVEQEMSFFSEDVRPLDFGWPGREGTQGVVENPPEAVNGPTISYDFGEGLDQGTGVIFGGLYRGPIDDLDNRFVFGDLSGGLWSIPFDDLTGGFIIRPEQMDRRADDFAPDEGGIESPIGFVVDDQERLFLIDSDGELFRFDPA